VRYYEQLISLLLSEVGDATRCGYMHALRPLAEILGNRYVADEHRGALCIIRNDTSFVAIAETHSAKKTYGDLY